MKCIQCQSIDLQSHKDHARGGFGYCKHETTPGKFASIVWERECPDFVAADAEIAARRQSWWAKVSGGRATA